MHSNATVFSHAHVVTVVAPLLVYVADTLINVAAIAVTVLSSCKSLISQFIHRCHNTATSTTINVALAGGNCRHYDISADSSVTVNLNHMLCYR